MKLLAALGHLDRQTILKVDCSVSDRVQAELLVGHQARDSVARSHRLLTSAPNHQCLLPIAQPPLSLGIKELELFEPLRDFQSRLGCWQSSLQLALLRLGFGLACARLSSAAAALACARLGTSPTTIKNKI